MGITIADVMRLPSMLNATIVAGEGGTSNLVESVTVLEYGIANELLQRLFRDNQFQGNELLLSAMANIRDDVDAQCTNIRYYHAVGSVGLVLYYVGVILPEIDQRLINLCDELNFVLICMPKGQTSLRYSEVISEVMFEIFREHQKDHFFVGSILDRMSNLSPQYRNLNTLLKMLSEHLHASVFMQQLQAKMNYASYWPQSVAEVCNEHFSSWLSALGNDSLLEVQLGESHGYLQKCPDLVGDFDLFILKYNEAVTQDNLWQASELIRLYIHIWDKNHGKIVTEELIRAIIEDDRLKKERLAQIFHIQVEKLNQMWLLIPAEPDERQREKILQAVSAVLSSYAKIVLIGYYETNLVAITDSPNNSQQRISLNVEISDKLSLFFTEYRVVCCDCIDNTEEARTAYLNSVGYGEIAQRIFKRKQVLSTSDILFAQSCQQISKEHASNQFFASLYMKLKAHPELLSTLETYFFDTSSNMVDTAKIQFIHINTVKYRFKTIQDLFGYNPTKMPDAYPLYVAAAISRINNSSV